MLPSETFAVLATSRSPTPWKPCFKKSLRAASSMRRFRAARSWVLKVGMTNERSFIMVAGVKPGDRFFWAASEPRGDRDARQGGVGRQGDAQPQRARRPIDGQVGALAQREPAAEDAVVAREPRLDEGRAGGRNRHALDRSDGAPEIDAQRERALPRRGQQRARGRSRAQREQPAAADDDALRRGRGADG